MTLRIETSTGANSLRVTHNDSELYFGYSVWQKLSVIGTTPVFRATNDYLAVLPDDVSNHLWECYVKAHEILRSHSDYSSMMGQLREQVQSLYSVLKWESVEQFCSMHPSLKFDQSAPQHRGPDELSTYTRNELRELAHYSVYLKIITPILGSIVSWVPTIVGNVMKEKEAMGVIVGSQLTTVPPYYRLRDYAVEIASSPWAKNVTPSLSCGLAQADIPEYLLAQAVIRRVANHQLSEPNLISYIHGFLLDQVNSLDDVNLRDKTPPSAAGQEQDQDSASDRHRIPETVQVDAQVATQATMRKLDVFISTVLETIGKNVIRIARLIASETPGVEPNEPEQELYDRLVKVFAVTDVPAAELAKLDTLVVPMQTLRRFTDRVVEIQNLLAGDPDWAPHELTAGFESLFMLNNIHATTMDFVEREGRSNTSTSISVTALELLGCETIARFVRATRLPGDHETLAMSGGGSGSIHRLHSSLSKLLDQRYRIGEADGAPVTTNPCEDTLAYIIGELNCYQWRGLGDMSMFRTETAKLYIAYHCRFKA